MADEIIEIDETGTVHHLPSPLAAEQKRVREALLAEISDAYESFNTSEHRAHSDLVQAVRISDLTEIINRILPAEG